MREWKNGVATKHNRNSENGEKDLIESVSVWVVCVSGFSFPFHVGAVFVSSSLCVQF